MVHQSADLDWRDGHVPISTQFDDPYFSLEDGLAETRFVFLAGNHLPHRFGKDFTVAELGFGTGLNFLVTWEAWDAAGCSGNLTFTSFEAFPMAPDDLARALAAFPNLTERARALIASMEHPGPWNFGAVTLELVLGDARETVPNWAGKADAWYLDGFAPARNPELWEPALLQAVANHTKPGGTLATYTAAGQVRRDLADAGFKIERAPGFGRKQHMTRGQKPHAK